MEGIFIPPSIDEIIDRKFYITLAYDLQYKKLYKVTKNVMFLLAKFGLKYIGSFLTTSFDLLCGKIQADVKPKDIRDIIGYVVSQNINIFPFYIEVAHFFDSLSDFPTKILDYLAFYISFPLVIGAIQSKLKSDAIIYLKNILLPSISNFNDFHLPKMMKVLLSEIGIDSNSIPESLFENEETSTQESDGDTDVSSELSNDLVYNENLLDFLCDFEADDVLNIDFLSSFFRSFNTFSLGEFLITMSFDKVGFIDYFYENNCFELFKGFFDDINELIQQFDIPVLEKTGENEINFIFRFIAYFSKDSIIETKPLLTNWNNKSSQFKLLFAIPDINNLTFNFADSNMHNLCFDSKAYMRKIVLYPDSDLVLKFFEINSKKYSDIILHTLIQIKKSCVTIFPQICSILEESIFENFQYSHCIHGLWEKDPKTMLIICQNNSNPYQIFSITPKKYWHYLFDSKDVCFATKLAIYASWYKMISFYDFIKNKLKYIDMITETIVQNLDQISDESINDFLLFASKTITIMSLESRNKIANVYEKIKSSRNTKSKFDFTTKIQISTEEFKFEATRRFESYFNFELSIMKLCNIMKKIFKEKYELFEYMIVVLLDELNHLSSHSSDEIEKILILLCEMIKQKLLKEQQLNSIFSFVYKSIELKNTEPNFGYASLIIEQLLQHFQDYILFGSTILQSDNFKNQAPLLFKKLESIMNTFTYRDFSSYEPEPYIHKALYKFQNISIPPVKKSKILHDIIFDNLNQFKESYEKHKEYSDFYINKLISYYLERPHILNAIIYFILSTKPCIDSNVVQFCCFKVYNYLKDPRFNQEKGSMLRRNTFLLGKMIGLLTLYLNKPKDLRFLNIPKLLEYALAYGKLYGIIPFINSIFFQCSPLFYPPNPFTSSILSLYASIYVIPNLKVHIKNHIQSLFQHFNVSLENIHFNDNLFTEKLSDNFDFIVKPFDIFYMFTEMQIKRIVLFDQNLYFCLIRHSLKIPNLPSVKNPLSIKIKIIWAVFSIIKSEAIRLSKIEISTTTSTILNDLMIVREKESIIKSSKQLIKQISAALVSQPVFFNYQEIFYKLIYKIIPNSEFCHLLIQLNDTWVHQFLSNVISSLVFYDIKEKIQNVSLEDIKLDHQKINAIKYSLNDQFAMLSISPEEAPSISININYDINIQQFCNSIERICNYEYSHGYKTMNDLQETSPLFFALKNINTYDPSNTNDKEIESIICSFFAYFRKSDIYIFHQALSYSFNQIFLRFDFKKMKELQNYFIKYIQKYPLPCLAISCLISHKILSEKQIDETYLMVLNKGYFSSEYLEKIIDFLDFYLVKEKNKPNDLLEILSFCSFVSIKTKFKTILRLRKLYSEFNAIKINKEEGNQRTPPEIIRNDYYNKQIQKWKNTIRTSNENKILQITKSLSKMPKDFFIVLFENETIETIFKLLKCINKVIEINTIEVQLFSAIYSLVSIAQVKDFSKIYEIIKILFKFDIKCSNLLNELKPLSFPSFTFVWISLITNSRFVVSLLQTMDGWSSYLPLLCHYSSCVASLSSSYEPQIFQKCYKSFCRFILILIHDFPDFIVASASMISSVFPSSFLQLKNILFSVTPTSIIYISPLTSDLKIDHLPDVHQTAFQIYTFSLPESIETILKNISIDINLSSVQLIIDFIEKQPLSISVLVNRLFEITFELSASTQRALFTNLPFFILSCYILCNCSVNTSLLYIEVLTDQLRYPSRNTHFFSKLLLSLFEEDLIGIEGINISEMISLSLFKRLSISPPYPWGLQVTTIELISNKELGFWDHQFAMNDKVSIFLKAISTTLFNQTNQG